MKANLLKALAVAVVLSVGVGPIFAKKSGGGASKADYRSAKSGKYVKQGHAEKNKSTTVREERQKK